MDILKVLSRGTKRTAKSTGNAATLPSAGTRTNPQLYHDEVRGLKRKRTGQETPETAEVELPEVDFFAPKPEPSIPASTELKKAARAFSPPPKPAKKLSEDECRHLLRSHRLKITVLSKIQDDQQKVKKVKKKKKAVKEEKKDDKKHTQLFPQPLESFADLRTTYGISRTIAENLVHQSYRIPTEVQMGSLPLLVRPDLALGGQQGADGVDFLAVAPTGSGKTISFLIPVINKIMRRREEQGLERVRELEAIVMAPTRELVDQIVSEGSKLAQDTGVKIVGMRKTTQLATEQQQIIADSSEESEGEEDDDDEGAEHDETAKRGKAKKPHPETKTDILVTTPTLLLNFLKSGPSGTHRALPAVRDLILDEADVLLDPLFRDQTQGVWDACPSERLAVSFWSATMGSNIESMVTEKLESRARSLSITAKPFIRLVVGLKDTAVPNIVHKLTYTASEQGKLLALRQLLHPTGSDDSGPPLRPPFLVFTQTIDRATALHDELKYDIPLEAGGPARIAALHSQLGESARSTIMRKFRAGEIWVLITTDVLARGVDFAGVNGVVNYDVPGSSAAYVHRAGRTGRAGREGGVAVTFYTKEDIPFVKTVANVIAMSEKQAGKTDGVQKWLLDALPNVAKADRKKLKERGVESRRGAKSITSKSGYDRKKEHNRRGAIDANKRRGREDGEEEEWTGFD